MFIYNLKVNGGLALKIIIVILSIFMAVVFGFSIYKIFFTSIISYHIIYIFDRI